MTEFIESPIYDNWIRFHLPQKSIVCVSPYIKKEAVYRVIPENIMENILVKVLIRGNKEEFTYQASSDIEALHPFYYNTSYSHRNFRRLQNLHMKAYLVDDTNLLVTSGNLTGSGMFLTAHRGNVEGGIATTDPVVIRKFLDYFDRLWKNAQPLNEFFQEISAAYIDYLQKKSHEERTWQEPKKHVYRVQAEPVASGHNTKQKFTLQDIPPKGDIEKMPLTLQILTNHDEAMTYRTIGNILRNQYGIREVDQQTEEKENQSDDKMGQEYCRLAGYFSLVNIEKMKRPNLITITELGREYLSSDHEARSMILFDQLLHREFFQYIKSAISKETMEGLEKDETDAKRQFRDMVYSVSDAEESSIDRSVHICRELLLLLYRQENHRW